MRLIAAEIALAWALPALGAAASAETVLIPQGAAWSDLGLLDGEGAASAAFHLPPGSDPGLAGLSPWHAYLTAATTGGAEFASNAVSLARVP